MQNLFANVCGKTLPKGLSWTAEPTRWMFDDTGRLIVQPRPGTDFHNGYNAVAKQDACFLYYVIQGDFTISSRVGGSLVLNGDAAAITVWSTPKLWAKLCLQKAKFGMQVVSVVSNPFSDVVNGELLCSSDGHLRITRRGDEFAMHFSRDGKKMEIRSIFRLG